MKKILLSLVFGITFCNHILPTLSPIKTEAESDEEISKTLDWLHEVLKKINSEKSDASSSRSLDEQLYFAIMRISKSDTQDDRNKKFRQIDELLKRGANPNYVYRFSRLLEYAIDFQNVELIKLLLRYGADPEPVLGRARSLVVSESLGRTQDVKDQIIYLLENYPRQLQEEAMERESIIFKW